MYEAKMLGHIINAGTVIEIPMEGDSEFKFQVLSVQENHFKVLWLAGSTKGLEDTVPYSIFGPKGTVELWKVSDRPPTEPNEAFKWRARHE